jgi:short-subunit dehydrogenase
MEHQITPTAHGKTVLVTGASSGIGLHLALRFAREGFNLVLVAPDEDTLRIAAEEVDNCASGRVRMLVADLEERDAAGTIHQTLADDGVAIDILVNDAGHGYRGRYWELPIATHLSVLRLNVEAVLRLTSQFLPEMVARGHGRILNVASVAGFEPGPLMAVYHATKAFVLSWSEALATELEGTGVTLTALCPGPTDTDFFPKGDMEQTRAFQKANLMAPQDVAEAGFDGCLKGERVVVPGVMNKALVFSRRFMSEHAQSVLNEALYTDVSDDDTERKRGDAERRDKAD